MPHMADTFRYERPLRFLTLLPLWEPVLTLWELGSLWLPRNSNTGCSDAVDVGEVDGREGKVYDMVSNGKVRYGKVRYGSVW